MDGWTIVRADGVVLAVWPRNEGGFYMRMHGDNAISTIPTAGTPQEAFDIYHGDTYKPIRIGKGALPLGQYYPRIWREMEPGIWPFEHPEPRQQNRVMRAQVQSARNLFAQLAEVFRYVEPSPATQPTYGDQIRALLILACTEVEASWQGVLSYNGYWKSADQRPTTKDYYNLVSPMRLSEWMVKLTPYPEYGPILPFADWKRESPTQSVEWYHAYNQTKHDRERHFRTATLRTLIDAMGGVYVMLAAQYGIAVADSSVPPATGLTWDTVPSWTMEELYVPPAPSSDPDHLGWGRSSLW